MFTTFIIQNCIENVMESSLTMYDVPSTITDEFAELCNRYDSAVSLWKGLAGAEVGLAGNSARPTPHGSAAPAANLSAAAPVLNPSMEIDDGPDDESSELDRRVAELSYSIHAKMKAVKKQRKIVQEMACQYSKMSDEVNWKLHNLVLDVRKEALKLMKAEKN